ncbi:MAG: hypothetical protein FWE37_02205 [Spirochaetaceae bacterium]|nr:hypothetical protein [Spirochaetaceae bacterium]
MACSTPIISSTRPLLPPPISPAITWHECEFNGEAGAWLSLEDAVRLHNYLVDLQAFVAAHSK